MRALAIILALASCAPRQPATWSGIPEGRVCVWSPRQRGNDPGRCIVGGQLYSCIWDTRANVATCAEAPRPSK